MTEYEKRGYLLENFRLFHLNSQGGTKVDYHYHEFCKLLLLVSGRGGYVVDGQRYLLQPGDVVLIGSRSAHRPELEEDSAYERIIIYIDPGFLQHSSTADCNLLELFSANRGHVLRLKENDRKKIFALAAALEKELSGADYGRILLCSTALLRLLVEIGRCGQNSENPQPAMTDNPRVRQWLQYIDRHLTEDLDVDTLAEAFFISKYHMMRLFHQETGFTVHKRPPKQKMRTVTARNKKRAHCAPSKSLVLFTDRMVANCPISLVGIIPARMDSVKPCKILVAKR